MKLTRFLPLVLGSLLLTIGCASPNGNSPAEKRDYTLKVREEALAQLAEREPSARAVIDASPGYIFVSGFSIHPGLCTLGNAYGVVQNNRTGKQTFIRLTRFAVGPGLAVKGYYGVVTLESEDAVNEFETGHWYGVAFADATFKAGDFGGSAAVGDTAGPSSHSWLWTHAGASLEVAAGGGKVYPADGLN